MTELLLVHFKDHIGLCLAQDLGYKGEIGYQTFLYSNEPEIRSLLMFLVEKLPRESAEASDQPAGKIQNGQTFPLYGISQPQEMCCLNPA